MITLGIDEVGRGCLAGPVVAGAVVLPARFHTKRGKLILRDSKLLSRAQREAWDGYIRRRALAIGLGWVWPEEIDRLGLTAAVRLAMHQALAAISCEYDEIIIDGNINYCADHAKARAIIKADNSVPAVSAAAIVAKVARDRYMAEIAQKYPGYGFEHHVGYGTRDHLAGLRSLGVSEIHRRSYEPVRLVLGEV